MRYLCIDLGDKRTGLAVGDDETGVVSPAGSLETAAADLLGAILEAIAAQGPDAIVVGLPLNMDGTEGPAARRVRALGRQLDERTDQPIYYHDERLTSHAADQRMARSGRTHKQKKALRNALAAAEILRDFLDQRGPTRGA